MNPLLSMFVGYKTPPSSLNATQTVAHESKQKNEIDVDSAIDSLVEEVARQERSFNYSRRCYFQAAQNVLNALKIFMATDIPEERILKSAVESIEQAKDALSNFPFGQEFKQMGEMQKIDLKDIKKRNLTGAQIVELYKKRVENLEIIKQTALQRYEQKGKEALISLEKINSDINLIAAVSTDPDSYDRETLQRALKNLGEAAKSAADSMVELNALLPIEGKTLLKTNELTATDSGNESESTLAGSPAASSTWLNKMG